MLVTGAAFAQNSFTELANVRILGSFYFTNWSAPTGLTATVFSYGGAYGICTNQYILTATNTSGRLPATAVTNVPILSVGGANSVNLTWQRKDFIKSYVIMRSTDMGVNWTNYYVLADAWAVQELVAIWG